MKPLSLYIHVPFCIKKCDYCDFYSVTDTSLLDLYTSALTGEIISSCLDNSEVQTIYFGGGTPSLLGAKRIERIMTAIGSAYTISPSCEVTLELNPYSFSDSELTLMREVGITRLSVGVQSLVDTELMALGRVHSAKQAIDTLLSARRAGFSSVSADIMLGIPGQDEKSLEYSLAGLIDTGAEHISAYILKLEPGTPMQDSGVALPDEEVVSDLYLYCSDRLERVGFVHYEVSNFARTGHESRHNLNYWRCGEYLGIGSGAHSFVSGKRFYMPRNLDAFLTAPEYIDDGTGGDADERLMLGLRLCEGIDLYTLFDRDRAARLLVRARSLERSGLLTVDGGRTALTKKGFLLSNSVIGWFLD